MIKESSWQVCKSNLVKSLKPLLSHAPYWGYLWTLMSRFQILQFPGPEMTSFPKKCKKRFQFYWNENSNFYLFWFDRFFSLLLLHYRENLWEKTCQIDVVNFFKFLCLEKFKTLMAIFEQSGHFWTWKIENLKSKH